MSKVGHNLERFLASRTKDEIKVTLDVLKQKYGLVQAPVKNVLTICCPHCKGFFDVEVKR